MDHDYILRWLNGSKCRFQQNSDLKSSSRSKKKEEEGEGEERETKQKKKKKKQKKLKSLKKFWERYVVLYILYVNLLWKKRD